MAFQSDVEFQWGDDAELIELLRVLIRIPSVNPPRPEMPDGELVAARFLADVLAAEGIPSTVVEPFPGRGSIVARVRGDGTGGDAMLLLSHLDVVPADPAGWSHEPFAADLEDGYVYGRGTIDMKSMVAMEVQLMRRLARAARAAGLDPATDPIPGLKRDVIFCCAADEEAGGFQGANWIVNEHPDWLRAAAAVNEAGGVEMAYGGTSFYPIQVAEKGLAVYRIRVHGRWGHASMPGDENAAVMAAEIITRLSEPGPVRLVPALTASFEQAIPHLPAKPAAALRAIVSGDAEPSTVDAALRELCDPVMARAISAVTRNTLSVGIVRAGLKYNVIPGVAELEVDCRTLPGTTEPEMFAEIRARIGEALWSHVEIERLAVGVAVEAPLDGELYGLIEQVVRDHDPAAVPLPFVAPFATDAKHLARIGVPVYGFSPLRLGDDKFLALMHATDERVHVEALSFGLPVLWDLVSRFCSH